MKSIRKTLTSHMTLWVGTILLLNAAVVFLGYRASMRAQLDESLGTRARTFAAMVFDDREDDELVFEFEGPITFESMGVWIRIKAGGETLAESESAPSGLFAPGVNHAEPGDPPVYSTFEPGWGTRYRLVALAAHALIDDEDSVQHLTPSVDQPVTIEIIADAGALLRDERSLATVLGIGLLIGVVVTTFAVRLGTRRGLAPVYRLKDELDRVSTETLSVNNKEAAYPDELRPIAAAVNGLLERLHAGAARERRFTDSAAHELRTPIAELTMLTDVAAKYPDETRQRKAIAEAGVIAGEMNALLESLLMVARRRTSEGGDDGPTALLPIARSLFAKHDAATRARSLVIELNGDEHAGWIGPEGAALIIVRNLIDNAVEYTPVGGAIRVSVTGNATGCVLEIENAPVRLAPGDADRLFEPFWRSDEARSERTHAGLGLSIVDAFCDTLGLSRRAVVTQDGTLRIRIERGE